MTYTHKNEGTCSRSVSFDVNEEGIVTNVRFEGGCNGNTKGVADELIGILSGIECGFKGTSCPDQLAKALAEIKK